VRSRWGEVQPSAADSTRYLKTHSWDDYGAWHLGLTDGAGEETKRRYAFVLGDFRRLHRMGILACHYRAAEWPQGHRASRPRAPPVPRHIPRITDADAERCESMIHCDQRVRSCRRAATRA